MKFRDPVNGNWRRVATGSRNERKALAVKAEIERELARMILLGAPAQAR